MSRTDSFIQTRPHTVIMLVGPTNCGKSYFASNVLIPQLQSYKIHDRAVNVQYLSSDQIRRELLGLNHFKYDPEMMAVSAQAFDILVNRLKNVLSYPVNAEFVILDTLGMHQDFREKVVHLAKENNYNLQAIIFDYKERNDFYKFVPEDENATKTRRLISKHLDRFRRDVLKEITKKNFYFIDKIKSTQFENYKIEIENFDFYASHFLPNDKNYIMIGDVHGCIDELKAIIQKHGVSINQNDEMENVNDQIFVLIGDIIDKGYGTIETIKFVHKNKQYFKLVKGNHENFIYKYLNAELKDSSISEDFKEEFFNSTKILDYNQEIKEKFFELVHKSREFYKHREFIVTHAPCENKHLGKINQLSLQSQRDIKYSKRRNFETDDSYKAAVEEQLSFLVKEACYQHPYHIFGHISVKNALKIKNKIDIDTGCTSGNKLTSVIITPEKPFFHSVLTIDRSKVKQEPLFSFFNKKPEKTIDLSTLEPYELKRLDYIVANKVNFISGTMSPSDKDMDNNELESLEKGLLYYKENGINKVVLQPKYMGSRCNIYLFDDIEKSYAVSRNGFIIDQIDLGKLYKKLHDKLNDKFKKDKVRLIILDGELMPWYALGKGLIDYHYKVVEAAIKQEIKFLKEYGFETELLNLQKDFYDNNLSTLMKEKNKKELKKMFGDRKYHTYLNFSEYIKSHISLEEQEKLWRHFSDQLKQYTEQSELNFKPFSILKIVYQNGLEELFFDKKTEDIYSTISDDSYLVIDMHKNEDWKKAKDYFEKLSYNEKMEGVVIKPETVYNPKIAPNIKVRNKYYLTLVYGYDYLSEHKYQKLINKKNINKKLRTSIKEFELAKKMLEVKYDDINPENEAYYQLVGQMILEVKSEKDLDPRL